MLVDSGQLRPQPRSPPCAARLRRADGRIEVGGMTPSRVDAVLSEDAIRGEVDLVPHPLLAATVRALAKVWHPHLAGDGAGCNYPGRHRPTSVVLGGHNPTCPRFLSRQRRLDCH